MSLTSSGFIRKRLSEIIEDILNEFESLYGSVIRKEATSIFGQFASVVSKSLEDIWEQMESVYLGGDPDSAEGVQLDHILKLNFLKRLESLPSVVNVGLNGTIPTVISSGTQLQSSLTNEIFVNNIDVNLTDESLRVCYVQLTEALNLTTYTITLNSENNSITTGVGLTIEELAELLTEKINNDSAIATAEQFEDTIKIITRGSLFDISLHASMILYNIGLFESLNHGPIDTTERTIENIVTPVVGLDTVLNFEYGIIGRNTETDAAARIRRQNSLQILGGGNLESIVARVFQEVDGVTVCKGFENREDTVVSGRPPHSIEIVVQGGELSDIGNKIWNVKGGGIQTFGNTYYDITDSNGDLQRMFFSRPVVMYTWVRATLSLYNEETYPVDGNTQVADKIKEYGDTFTLGLDILPQRFLSSIFEVPGISSVVVEVFASTNPGDTPVYQTTPFNINETEIAVFNLTRITVLS